MELARLPRFRARIGGLGIPFVHARAAASAGTALPLVLCHGWPDSFWRYTKVVLLLTGACPARPRRTRKRSELATRRSWPP
ncbi:epoxide hydrolase N-terminal domain-containing protein [Streptomyces sp. NPDC050625]|uniref:epoxide hydrolase N-terminal domain-containing protein n=1 Tax=Streptomyces sp. NPDC050625 TaxID=3154629 RepID=UPI0034382E9A